MKIAPLNLESGIIIIKTNKEDYGGLLTDCKNTGSEIIGNIFENSDLIK